MSSYRPNPLSAIGRMGYATHLLFYPAVGAFYVFVVKPYLANKKIADREKEWAAIPPARKVDPDLFNPFTPIPYHNNPELKYVFAHINMHNYLNKNHINTEDYAYKNFHNSYDHNNKYVYTYNWISFAGPKE